MKRTTLLIFLLLLSLATAACSTSSPAAPEASAAQPAAASASEATPTPYAAAYLSITYSDAASLRNQLAYGTLLLEGSEQAVTSEQAKTLLPFWQAIVALSGDETTAAEELTAVQNQVSEAMTPAQLEAIAALQITNADLNAFYAERGIVFPTPVPGVTKVPGSGKNVSPEDKEATRTAAEALGTPVSAGSGAGQAAKTVLFETVIELLNVRAAQ